MVTIYTTKNANSAIESAILVNDALKSPSFDGALTITHAHPHNEGIAFGLNSSGLSQDTEVTLIPVGQAPQKLSLAAKTDITLSLSTIRKSTPATGTDLRS